MALKPNAVLKFTSYEIEKDGVKLWFVCHDPGPGEASDYSIFFSDAELGIVATPIVVTNLATFQQAVLAKFNRMTRAQGIASKLDSLIGRSITLP